MLKAYLSRDGSDVRLKTPGLRHNLNGLWALAAAEGLRVDATPPDWADCLSRLHDKPFRLPYSTGVHGVVLPAAETIASRLQCLLGVVREQVQAHYVTAARASIAHVIGVDLSGPAGTVRTGVALFTQSKDRLQLIGHERDGSDDAIRALVAEYAGRGLVVVGIDAPLSYQPGGGERDRDAQLRAVVVRLGLRPGAVMAPTATRMAYLTLRGLALARALQSLDCTYAIRIVEVHPGAALIMRGAPLDAVLTFKRDAAARSALLRWLQETGLMGFEDGGECGEHFIAACAAACAAHDWSAAKPRWLARASPSWHPYDFAC